MFVASGQFYYFAECVFIGAFSGVIGEVMLIFVPVCVKTPFFRHVVDFLRYGLVAIAYYRLSPYYKFPDFAPYMAVGVILGNALEYATLHNLLAKYAEIWYNKVVKYIRSKFYDRKKNAKSRRGRHGRRRRNAFHTDFRADFPDGYAVGKKTRIRKTKNGIRRIAGKV